jgi:hypothetical protein
MVLGMIFRSMIRIYIASIWWFVMKEHMVPRVTWCGGVRLRQKLTHFHIGKLHQDNTASSNPFNIVRLHISKLPEYHDQIRGVWIIVKDIYRLFLEPELQFLLWFCVQIVLLKKLRFWIQQFTLILITCLFMHSNSPSASEPFFCHYWWFLS